MADEFDEPDHIDDSQPIWDTPGDDEALQYALSDDDPPRQRRTRLLLGAVCVAVGLLVAALAVNAASSDDGGGSSKDADKATTTTDASNGGSKTSVASATTDAEGASAEPAWPSALGGRPPALGKQGEPPPTDVGDLEPGFYLWQDFGGWHAWLVGGSEADRLTITSDAEIAKADPVGGEVAIDRLPNTFGFTRGAATEAVVGVDFNPGYYAKTFVVTINGETKLHIGARRWGAPQYYGVQKNTANA